MPLATDRGAPPANVSRPTANAQALTPTDDNHSKETFPVPNPTHNGRHPGNGDPDPIIPQATLDPLSEAEALRGLLAEAQSRLSRLIAALKLHKKQTRAVQAAVASLKQLPPLAP